MNIGRPEVVIVTSRIEITKSLYFTLFFFLDSLGFYSLTDKLNRAGLPELLQRIFRVYIFD